MIFLQIINIFLNFILAPTIFILSLTGNILGISVFIRQKTRLIQITPVRIYKSLFVFNSIYSIQILLTSLSSSSNLIGFNISTLSNLSCKFTNFFRFAFDSFAPYFLVYISIEKFISIKYKEKMFILRNDFFQFLFVLGLFFLNMIVNIVLAFVSSDLIEKTVNINNNNDNSTTLTTTTIIICDFISSKNKLATTYIDIVYRLVIPSLIMIFLSYSLFKIKLIESADRKEKRRLQKEIQYAISSILMNIIYVVFNVPVVILTLISSFSVQTVSDELFLFFYYLYFLAYGCSYYAIYIFNPSFRSDSLNTFRGHVIRANESIEMSQTNTAARHHQNTNSSQQHHQNTHSHI
jgi:hypothetical protein